VTCETPFVPTVSSLKVREMSLNEHEFAKKTKSIALPSKGKSSKALKFVESEEESPDGDSDEDLLLWRRWLCSPTSFSIWLGRTRSF